MSRPTLWNRFVASINGEVSADTLEAFRRASLAVYDALDHVQKHRDSAGAQGLNAWTLAPATQVEILCTWNAFVLQTLGDAVLDADYARDPATRGFVPPAVADQSLSFYSQVEGWLSRAGQAHFNPAYRLDVYVPAQLPPWNEATNLAATPTPSSDLHGLMEAMRSVREHTKAALAFLGDEPPQDAVQAGEYHAIRQLQAATLLKARYAEDLAGGAPPPAIQTRIQTSVREAIEGFYRLGQLAAMPTLALRFEEPPAPAPAEEPEPQPVEEEEVQAPAAPFDAQYFDPDAELAPWPNAASPRQQKAKRMSLPGPNEADFDPWCLSDPDALPKLSGDKQARRAINTMWKADPDPTRTLAIQEQINAALERGDIAFARDRYGSKLGHYFACPWAPVYEVKRSLSIGGRGLRTMQQFFFHVAVGDDNGDLSEGFTREIMTGTFSPTSRFKYVEDVKEKPRQ
jgi:hypothetical protein